MHTLYYLKSCLHALCFFNCDDAFFTDLVHGFGDDISDGLIIVGGDRTDLSDFALVFGLFAHGCEFFHGNLYSLINPALNGHGIVPGGHEFLSFFINGSG